MADPVCPRTIPSTAPVLTFVRFVMRVLKILIPDCTPALIPKTAVVDDVFPISLGTAGSPMILYPVVQAAVFLLASGFVITNTIVDILYGVVDPRIRYS